MPIRILKMEEDYYKTGRLVEVMNSDKAQKDGAFWEKLRNKIIMNKITALIVDI
jgi:hypothetical protein